MNIEHDSRKKIYRNPAGALKCGSTAVLRVAVESYAIPESVECIINGKSVDMHFVEEVYHNRIYECKIRMPEKEGLLWYGFKVCADGKTAYCGNNPEFLGGKGRMYAEGLDKLFQITVYSRDYKTPDWMKEAVVYQIFPDRFCRHDDTPFHGIRRNWGEQPFYKAQQFGGEYTSDDFFGGNLSGIKSKLNYFKELGISAIYLNPIFKSQSNHRYNTGDYETVDPLLGTNEEFADLAELFKENGIRIILDGVFSHTGDDSRYFNKYGNYPDVGAYQSRQSPYIDWYDFKNWPNDYESWWGFQTLPNTKEMSESYLDYIVRSKDSVVRKWIKLGASGWRLDVADELPDEFIKELRKGVKEENSDAVVIGEVWEDASNKVSYGAQREYFFGKSLDSVMNYVSRGAILDYLRFGNAGLFFDRLMSVYENYPKEALYTCLNLISTHDVPRAMTILSGAPDVSTMDREAQAAYKMPHEDYERAKRKMRMAAAIQMTIPGTPCVYYGDEIGMCGYTDPFNRACYPWGEGDGELFELHKRLIKLRNSSAALKTGELIEIFRYNDMAVYMRCIRDGKDVFGNDGENEMLLVAVNPVRGGTTAINISLKQYGVNGAQNVLTGENVPVDNGNITINVAQEDFEILKLDFEPDIIEEL